MFNNVQPFLGLLGMADTGLSNKKILPNELSNLAWISSHAGIKETFHAKPKVIKSPRLSQFCEILDLSQISGSKNLMVKKWWLLYMGYPCANVSSLSHVFALSHRMNCACVLCHPSTVINWISAWRNLQKLDRTPASTGSSLAKWEF